MIICVILAYFSEKQTRAIRSLGKQYSVWNDPAYLALAVVLILFAGLRTNYNDTWNYMNSFRKDQGLAAFLSGSQNLNLFRNPLFYFYYSALRDVTGNAQWLVFTTSVVTQLGFLLFFKRYSHNFTFSVFIYFALGTINVSIAAMKQVCAMAIVTMAFPCLEKKQWLRYYLVVFVAMMVHTYAMAYAVLPFFRGRPWKAFTYLFVLVVVVVMMNFTEVITAFMDKEEEVGKTLYAEEIFHDYTVNILRVSVYAVAPLISFFFQKWIFRNSTTGDHIVVHMSIISFAFMVMGTQSGANMFARMSHYFELGTICCLPFMLKQTFEQRSYQLVSRIAIACFLFYFIYANAINTQFDAQYSATNIFALFG